MSGIRRPTGSRAGDWSSKAGRHLRDNVVGYLALFLALSIAPAYAATIGSRDIVRNAVLSKHIKRGNVKASDLATGAVNSAKVADGNLSGADVADGSLSGADVADGGLTGADVADGSLGAAEVNAAELQRRVTGSCAPGQAMAAVAQDGGVSCAGTGGPPSGPAGGDLTGDYPAPELAAGAVDSAKVADNSLTGLDLIESTLSTVPAAASIGGVRMFQFEFNAGAGTGPFTLFSPPDSGGFTIEVTCTAGSDLVVQAHAPAGGDLLMSSSVDTVTGSNANPIYQAQPTDVDLAPDDDDQIGQTVYRVGTTVLSIDWIADNSGLSTCDFNGVAMLH